MPTRPDGQARAAQREQRRIDWGRRRREVQRILRQPEQLVPEGLGPLELWDLLWQALYVAESTAERGADPELLSATLRAKGAAGQLWKLAGSPMTA